MKPHFPLRYLLVSLAALGGSHVAQAACTQTLNPGANVASAVSSAAAGSTICLNAGSYGSHAFVNIAKSSPVTIQSTSGQTASIRPDVYSSSNLVFANLTMPGLEIREASRNVRVQGTKFTGQAILRVTSTDSNVVIDSSTFDGISVCTNCYEGRLQIVQGHGVKITNSHFGGGGESDGIQLSANGATIGPGNVFEGIIQGSYGRHIDAIQGYGQSNTTIVGNYFTNNTIYVGMYDGGRNETITGNVFGPSATNEQKLQLGSIQGLTFTHNTAKGRFVVAQGAKSGMARNSNAVYRNNIFDGTSIADTGDQPGCSTGCVYERNLFTSSSSARGSNNLIGTPTYAGGATSWPGYKLSTSSLGYKAATDGADVGITYYGPGTSGGTTEPTQPAPVVLSAPTSLRVVN